ncbi:MAG: hypothetical protein ISR75_02280, partial [Phycisphaerales bacterium]|nr:hypothetical protein [Phycisphaerales bacterium]
MKNFTTCICILGLSGTAFGGTVMDQIGPDDGSGIGTNITGSQDFEAAYDIYDIATMDNFTGGGEDIDAVEMVLNGWNGFVDPSSVSGYTANLHSDPSAAAVDLIGDIGSSFADAADATVSGTWAGGGFNVSMPTAMIAAVGTNWVSMVPSNDFATGGQTGVADTVNGDGTMGWQANPGGGFGMPGNMQEMTNEAAYRVHMAGMADPCSLPLPQPCPADINQDGNVTVSDVLAVIGTWGTCGDGTFRPEGDVAPAPNGDCCVNVSDVLAVVGAFGGDCTVYGACCASDGTCDDMSNSTDCAANGGDYFGDNSLCADNSCVAAACCIDANTCADITEDACNAMGGTYKGDGTSCAGTDCAAVEAGDECTAAIAVFDGANAFDTTNMTPSGNPPTDDLCPGTFLDWLESQDGWYVYVATGGLTTFDTCDASSYDTSMALYEGSCTNLVACNGDAADSAGCQAYSSEIANYDCVAGETYYVRLGAWQGDGAGPGTLNINPPATGNGACCFADESCLELDAADCEAFGGFFQGDGTSCGGGMCEAGPGDDCSSATEAFEGPNAFDTTLATPSADPPDDTMCAGTALDWMNSPDMWMFWVATGDGTATFSACDAASYDTSMV